LNYHCSTFLRKVHTAKPAEEYMYETLLARWNDAVSQLSFGSCALWSRVLSSSETLVVLCIVVQERQTATIWIHALHC